MDLGRMKRNLLMSFRTDELQHGPNAGAQSGNSVSTSPMMSSESERHGFSFSGMRHKARKSIGHEGDMDFTGDSSAGRMQGRKLSKSRRTSSSAAFEVLNRRGSGFSEDSSRISRTSTTLSTSSSTTVDWRTQHVEGVASLEPDPQLLRNKTPYVVVTSDFVVKLKSHADVVAVFPQLVQPGKKPDTSNSHPDPILTIPVASIVSCFIAESTRPSFGMEVWWRSHTSLAFQHTTLFFNLPTERQEQMGNILKAMAAVENDLSDLVRYPVELTEPLKRIHAQEEPRYQHQKLEVFPVVTRGRTRRERDESLKKLPEASSSYLVIGAHLCYLVDAYRGPGRRPELVCKHTTFGLVTLESVKGDWVPHQERFNLTFRHPFKAPVTLELASRFYRRIIRVLGKADRFLKPAWPALWRTLEVFNVTGLKEPHHLVPREDYGSVQRTLDAYLAAYRCPPVEWEINWRTQYCPQFRLRPAQHGPYTALQLLAVLRALRYNDFFSSLSFQDVDLSVLWNWHDNSSKSSNVAYLDRNCVALGADEVDVLRVSPVLYQEFHALAFCSGTIRQMDFTNSFRTPPAGCDNLGGMSVQFLSPILKLLQTGGTKCSELVLSGCSLGPTDVDDLVDALKCGAIHGLDVARCGLKDMDLRELLDAASIQPQFLQMLNVSNNTGRFPASIIPGFVAGLYGLRVLNVAGSLRGDEGFRDVEEPLIHFETLAQLTELEELDLSQCKLSLATLYDLEEFLAYRSNLLDEGEYSRFHRLVLNNCGITGEQAARLFNAIGMDHGVHIFLNGNPLEEGIEHLSQALCNRCGPAGLTMEMVDFKSERRYCDFIRALTVTPYLQLLSMVGTSPTLPSGTACHQQTALALQEFFAKNSLQYLDMSGFRGRLDEGQLAQGFGHSVIGLAKNTSLKYLRIRNQNLHEDAGTLGTVLAENSCLRMFDCQDNGLNMTSLQFLVSSMRNNYNIVDFPFPLEERERIWASILAGLRRQNIPSSGKKEKAGKALASQETMLRAVFDEKFAELDRYLARNREAREHVTGCVFDYESPTETGGEEGWPRLDQLGDTQSAVAGYGYEQYEVAGLDPVKAEVGARRPATIRSSSIAINTSILAPYHVSMGEGAESPTETLDPVSEIASSPETTGLRTPEDEALEKVLLDFGKTAFHAV